MADTGAPGNIPLFGDGDPFTPIQAPFNAISQALNAALINLQKASTPKVASVAARNTLFPSAAQGDRVWRSDLNYMEAYFETYNATTNPGGALVAGWYPATTGSVYGRSRRTTAAFSPSSWADWSSAFVNTDVNGFANQAVGWTIPVSGVYRIDAWGTFGTGNSLVAITSTPISGGTSPRPGNLLETSASAPFAFGMVGISQVLPLNANDKVYIGGISTGAWDNTPAHFGFNVTWESVRKS